MFSEAGNILGREGSQEWVPETLPEVDGRAGLSCRIPEIEVRSWFGHLTLVCLESTSTLYVRKKNLPTHSWSYNRLENAGSSGCRINSRRNNLLEIFSFPSPGAIWKDVWCRCITVKEWIQYDEFVMGLKIIIHLQIIPSATLCESEYRFCFLGVVRSFCLALRYLELEGTV